MSKTLPINSTIDKARRRRAHYPFLPILAGFLILIAWGISTLGRADAAEANLPHSTADSSASVAYALVDPMTPGYEERPAMAYNSTSGEYLVVWQEPSARIYGQRVSSDGVLVGSNFSISTTAGSQYRPAVAYNSTSGEYMVVWGDDRNGGSGNRDIYAQRVSGNGALVGSDFSISIALDIQWNPAVAYNSTSGEFLVVWGDNRNTSGWVIYGQRVSGNGVLDGSNFPISQVFGGVDRPAMAYNSANGEYLVTWHLSISGIDCNIYGQRVSGNGTLVGSNVHISSSTQIYQYSPAVAYNGISGEYLVTWSDIFRKGSSNSDIYGQRVSSSGTLVGSEIQMSTESENPDDSAVAYNSTNGEYLVVWHDVHSDTTTEISGQRVSGSGVLMGNEIRMSTASTGQFTPAVAYNGTSNEYLVIWLELSGDNNYDIYGQRVSGSGALVGSNFPITGGTPSATPTPTPISTPPTATPTPCVPGQFSDVPPDHTFYQYVSCLVDRGVMSGYADCTFRPSNNLTRGQLAKVVSNAANFNEPHTSQTFEDVASDHTFYVWIERLASRGIIGGYECGGENEPCVPPLSRPYFRSGNNVTRGQTAKIVAIGAGLPAPPQGSWTFQDVPEGSTFWQWVEALSAAGAIGGYECGGEGEPCVSPDNRPYFRSGNNVTRGQASKIVASTFFPDCHVSNRR